MFRRKAARQKRELVQQVADLKVTVQAVRKQCETLAADRDVWEARATRHAEDATRQAQARRTETTRLQAQLDKKAAELDTALYGNLLARPARIPRQRFKAAS